MAEFGGTIIEVFEKEFLPERVYGIASQMLENRQDEPTSTAGAISDIVDELNLEFDLRDRLMDAIGTRLSDCAMKLYSRGFKDGISLGQYLLSDKGA